MGQTFYHGTVDTYLPDIKIQGLRPTAKNRYHATGPDGQIIERGTPVAVYLTASEYWGKIFAVMKSNYLAAKPGVVMVPTKLEDLKKDAMQLSGNAHVMGIYKTDKTVIKANPVLLTIEVPETLVSTFHRDFEAMSKQQAVWTTNVIQPNWITKVESI